MLRILYLTIIVVCSSASGLFSPPLQATPLIVGVSDNQGAPFIIRHNNQVTGGILKELMDELGQRLNLEVEYLPVPRKRLEQSLASGEIHLLSHTNPAWLSNASELLWSPPWLEDQDLFVTAREASLSIYSFDALINKRLGTIRGYRYSELEFWFEHRLIYRDDALNLQQNFNKLALGRIDALIDSKVLIDYFLQQHPQPEQFQVAEKIADQHSRFIALSPLAPCSIQDLSESLQQMLDNGIIERILSHYQ